MSLPSANAFAGLRQDQHLHFALHLYGAVLYLLRHLESLGPDSANDWYRQFPFLQRYLDEAHRHLGAESQPAAQTLHRWRVELTAWASAQPRHFPLQSLRSTGRFAEEHFDALLFAGLPEEDSRFGTVFARLQDPLAQRTPTLELASRILGGPASDRNGEGWALFDPLLAAGLLRISNPDAPRTEWLLKPPRSVWNLLRGDPITQGEGAVCLLPQTAFGRLEELVLDPALQPVVRNLPELLAAGGVSALILRGMEGSGRMEFLGAVARSLDRAVISVRIDEDRLPAGAVEELGPLCLLSGAIPALRYEPGPGQTVEPPPLKGYAGLIAILLGNEGGVRGGAAERSLTVSFPPARFAERYQHWRRHLNGHPISDLNAIAERFHLPPGLIRRAARSAVAHAQLNGGQPVTPAHVRRACRELGHERLDALAERLDTSGDSHDLIVSPGTRKTLTELEDRCRHRERLLDQLGEAFRSNNRGVRALFTGASGTGKTLAAKLLSAILEKDLYRIDLAAVVNKYIGETEKNLHRVLSRAEELDVILLLDEGDALLGNRTEVRSANDRYANLETNYLLQRLEHYQGIVVVTTNVGDHIDPAFRRRMDTVVEFVRPRRDERRRLWDLHLPRNHRMTDAFLEEVATRCPFTGGQIRNAAAAASLLALRQHRSPLDRHHLIEALRSECRKAGLVAPDLTALPSPERGMAGFLSR